MFFNMKIFSEKNRFGLFKIKATQSKVRSTAGTASAGARRRRRGRGPGGEARVEKLNGGGRGRSFDQLVPSPGHLLSPRVGVRVSGGQRTKIENQNEQVFFSFLAYIMRRRKHACKTTILFYFTTSKLKVSL
jgi:hypothetical protein